MHTLYSVHCTIHTAYCNTHCTLYTAHILHMVKCTLYTTHDCTHNTQNTLHTAVQCLLYTVHCIVETAHWILYTEHSRQCISYIYKLHIVCCTQKTTHCTQCGKFRNTLIRVLKHICHSRLLGRLNWILLSGVPPIYRSSRVFWEIDKETCSTSRYEVQMSLRNQKHQCSQGTCSRSNAVQWKQSALQSDTPQ